MQYTVKINIIITATDLINGEKYILSTSPDTLVLPTYELSEPDTIDGVVEHLCQECVHLDVLWMKPRCVSVVKDDDSKCLYVNYVSVVPLDTKLLNNTAFISLQATPTDVHITEAISQYEII